MFRFISCGFICLLLFGCTGFQIGNKYITPYENVYQLAQNNQIDVAISALESTGDDQEKSQVLHHLQLALLYMRMGEHQKSNQQLERAKQQDTYLRRVSASEQAASIALNDTVTSYTTSDYERVWLFALKLINYAQTNNIDALGVELRQLDLLLKEADEARLADYAFIYYLAGISYEIINQPDDALIAYRDAYQAYGDQAPEQVRLAYARMLIVLRATSEIHTLTNNKERTQLHAQLTQKSCVFTYMQGQAPMKRPASIRVFEHGVAYTIDVPRYPPAHTTFVPDFSVGVLEQKTTVIIEPVDRRVRAELARGMPAITAKTVARVVAKKTLFRSNTKNNEAAQAARLLSSLFVALTEGADLRSWNLLPANLFIVRYYTNDTQCVADIGKIQRDITNRVTLVPFFLS